MYFDLSVNYIAHCLVVHQYAYINLDIIMGDLRQRSQKCLQTMQHLYLKLCKLSNNDDVMATNAYMKANLP